MSLPIRYEIRGFYSDPVRLWKLGFMLDETWPEECIFNTLAELFYFRYSVESAHSPDSSRIIYLPTWFYTGAHRLYHLNPRLYSNNINTLRGRLRTSNIQHVAFLVHQNSHFTAYIYDFTSTLTFVDSAGGSAKSEVLDILGWVLGGLEIPLPLQFNRGLTDLQSFEFGSGSCGFAAHYFVMHFLDATRWPPWCAKNSQYFREQQLCHLLLYLSIVLEDDTV